MYVCIRLPTRGIKAGLRKNVLKTSSTLKHAVCNIQSIQSLDVKQFNRRGSGKKTLTTKNRMPDAARTT